MSGQADRDAPSLRDVLYLLLYGDRESRRAFASELGGQPELLEMLARTARLDGSLLLRARCLEALGLLAADAADAQRVVIVDALFTDTG